MSLALFMGVYENFNSSKYYEMPKRFQTVRKTVCFIFGYPINKTPGSFLTAILFSSKI